MNFIAKLGSGISKGVLFVLHVLTNTGAVLSVINKVGPTTLAAILAVFYDLMTLFIRTSGDIATKNFTDIFSPTTQSLLAKLHDDLQAGETIVVSDFHQLGIAIQTPAAGSGTTVTS